MRVEEKIQRMKPETLICGIDIGKTNCCARSEEWRYIKKFGLIELKI